jgi:hypothetical protein
MRAGGAVATAVLLAACGGARESERVRVPVVVDGSALSPSRSDLGY